uniref:Uncharacterized protein n=1 Tax=Anguilla anguilla TaxID=7936 RepID=A0A0E9QB29_ANGAN
MFWVHYRVGLHIISFFIIYVFTHTHTHTHTQTSLCMSRHVCNKHIRKMDIRII